MKATLVLSLALIISGCAGTSEQAASANGYDPIRVLLAKLRQGPGASAVNSPAGDGIPVLVIRGDNNVVDFREENKTPVRPVEKDQIASISSEYARAGTPIIIAVDASRVREQKYLTDPSLRETETNVSLVQRPNPDHQAAEEAQRKAENDLREAEQSDKEVQQQAMPAAGTPNAGAWGVAGGLVASASDSSLRRAQESYEKANEVLKATKRWIQAPVYETSKEPAASYVTLTSGAIFAYVIDVAGASARRVKVPIEQEIKSQFEYHAGTVGNIFESASLPAHLPVLSVDDIMKESAGAPTVALAQIADDVAAGRKLFAAETAALQQQRAELTSNTLSQLESLAAKPQLPVAAAQGNGSAGEDNPGADGQCLVDTSSLAEKLKRTGVPSIDEVRDQVVAVDIVSAMRQASESGLTHSAAIQQAIEQVKEFERTAGDALGTAGQVDAIGQSDEEFLAYMGRGQVTAQDCEAKGPAAICAAIVSRMGSLVNRLIAHAMTCHDLKGSWPK